MIPACCRDCNRRQQRSHVENNNNQYVENANKRSSALVRHRVKVYMHHSWLHPYCLLALVLIFWCLFGFSKRVNYSRESTKLATVHGKHSPAPICHRHVHNLSLLFVCTCRVHWSENIREWKSVNLESMTSVSECLPRTVTSFVSVLKVFVSSQKLTNKLKQASTVVPH